MSESTKSKRGPHYINSNVAFVHQGMLIQDAVQEMIDKNISSILVEDEHGTIVGIVTERDILRKFTLLDVGDKLTRTVGTIMTRPVAFVQVKDFHKQIVKLHLEQRIRHFPVLTAPEPKKENLMGIVSITDVARHYMMNEQHQTQPTKDDTAPVAPKMSIGVMASGRALVNTYMDIFNNLGFAAREVSDIFKFADEKGAHLNALILDLDGYNDQQTHQLIPVVVKAKFHLILTTSQPSMVPIFKKYLNRDHQEIAMKPLDIGYVTWLLQSKWRPKAPPAAP